MRLGPIGFLDQAGDLSHGAGGKPQQYRADDAGEDAPMTLQAEPGKTLDTANYADKVTGWYRAQSAVRSYNQAAVRSGMDSRCAGSAEARLKRLGVKHGWRPLPRCWLARCDTPMQVYDMLPKP